MNKLSLFFYLIYSCNSINCMELEYLPIEIKFEIFKNVLIELIQEHTESDNIYRFNIFFNNILKIALINKEFKDFVRFYIPAENKADFLHYFGESLISISILNGRQNFLEFIVNNINLSQQEKNIALKWFAIYKNKSMIERFLAMGANCFKASIKIFDKNFNLINNIYKDLSAWISINKALISAVRKRNLDTIKYLLLNGADINAKNSQGYTSLMFASTIAWREDIVKLLLSQSYIDVNIQDPYGNTALILAAVRGAKNIVKILLLHPSININVKNNNGDEAVILAKRYGHKNIVKLLYDYEYKIF